MLFTPRCIYLTVNIMCCIVGYNDMVLSRHDELVILYLYTGDVDLPVYLCPIYLVPITYMHW